MPVLVKNPGKPLVTALLVRAVVLRSSFSLRRSTMSRKTYVRSRLNLCLRASSMMRQDGFASVATTRGPFRAPRPSGTGL